jgi:hypothetical protein
LKTDIVHLPQQKFDKDKVTGAAAKEILRSLLESAEYEVYPFGYESTLSVLKRRFGDRSLNEDPVSQRIRSMPDFLVADSEGKEPPQLIEVKFRRVHENPTAKIVLKNWDLVRYAKHWPETVLVLLSPFRDHFFAQHVKNLQPEGDSFGHTGFEYTKFSSISNFFSRTRGKLEPFYGGIDRLAGLWKEEGD